MIKEVQTYFDFFFIGFSIMIALVLSYLVNFSLRVVDQIYQKIVVITAELKKLDNHKVVEKIEKPELYEALQLG